MTAGQITTQSYPEDWVHVYTDGSALKGCVNAGYGARIEYPDRTCEEIYSPCGALCSNFEAEALAIEASIRQIRQNFVLYEEKQQKIVIFTDSKSVLQALDNNKQDNASIRSLTLEIDNFIKDFDQEITLQWIPSHCNIPGNERADTLAKKGASLEQPNRPVSQKTAKQIIRSNTKLEWYNQWALSDKGRVVFQYMPKPNKMDPINTLRRRDQVNIFRLRTQHVPLNMHINRIKPEHAPLCSLCDHPYETVKHFLFECPPLEDLRQQLLPPSPDLGNTLYSTADQLKQTSTFYIMANHRRAQAQMAAGSAK